MFDTYQPLKRSTNVNFKDKPWTFSSLSKSIPIKNHKLSKFIRLKDPGKKR